MARRPRFITNSSASSSSSGFISFIVLLVLLFFCALGGAALSADGVNLLAFKAGVTDSIGYLSNWIDKDEVPCSWTGVSCDEFSQVTILDLSSMNLTGKLHSSIGSLASLSTLNLSDNALWGPIPEQVANFSNLDTLDVSVNQFTGNLLLHLDEQDQDKELKLQGLVFLSAHDNNFTGPLPRWVSRLPMLQMLDLAGSYFSGTIPPDYGSLSRLETLKVSGNLLVGQIPPQLGQLSQLKHLELGYNNYSAGIPAELGMLSELEYLDLSWTGLTGSIPKELGNLSKCHTAFLYKNSLSGQLPPELGGMLGLLSLDASDNALTGSIPPEWGTLKRLTLLHLMMNKLDGDFPHFLGDLNGLETLSLWNNLISGSLPASLGRSRSLSWIDVSSNLITGSIPQGICDGGSLIKLELFSNSISGPIPNMSNCTKLYRARLHDNLLSGPIPSAFFDSMANLSRLELSKNRLTGVLAISRVEGSPPRLAFIDISNNEIEGAIPDAIWTSLPQLQELHAASNKLSGPIPAQGIGNASWLSVLDLSSNELTGSIPAELSSCSRLVSLNLRGNKLAGGIPPELASLPILAVADLSSNLLTGRVPPQFASSRSLEELNVSHNALSGELPGGGLFVTASKSSFEGNTLCGGVLPPCSAGSEGRRGSGSFASRRSAIAARWLLVAVVVLSIGMLAIGLRYICRRRRDAAAKAATADVGGGSADHRRHNLSRTPPWRMTTFQRLSMSMEEILDGISEANVLGKGGSGIVYRVESRELVAAAKLLNHQSSSSVHPSRHLGFLAEINLLGRIRHRNIVRLLGYCTNSNDDMLLYEFMPQGSLNDLLHAPHGASPLLAEWMARYKVAMGVAQGLAYLHHDCSPQVVHRDVKSSNILLDNDLEARVADFGLAKLMEAREDMSVVAGSYGYIAPEYAYTMKVREKCDIYSYGVVLLELLTGKRPIEPEFGESGDIVDWVHSKLRRGRLVDVLDPIMGECEHVREEMLLVLRIAMLCTSRSPRDRPSMRDVVSMLAEAEPRRKSSKEVHRLMVIRPSRALEHEQHTTIGPLEQEPSH